MRLRFRDALVLLLLVAGSCLCLSAQSGSKDEAELQHFTLTMDNATRFYNAMAGLTIYSQAHPEAASSLHPSNDDDSSIDKVAARIASIAPAVAILQQNGFTPHQFIVTELALIQAGLAASLIPAGSDGTKQAEQAGINPANIVFVQKHKAELEAMQQKIPKSD